MEPYDIVIRSCSTLEEWKGCVELQRQVWKDPDLDVTPHYIFAAAAESGGRVLGAFDGNRMVGFVLAFAGLHGRRPFFHSHMAAVLPDYQNRGIGRRLKMKQREEALGVGIDLIEWTFDPLALRNAHFNINRLGVIIRRFIPNFYGVTGSPLHRGLPTDRLVAEWWLKSARVKSVLAGIAPTPELPVASISIPARLDDLADKDLPAVAKVQAHARAQFQNWLKPNCAITRFDLNSETGTYWVENFSS